MKPWKSVLIDPGTSINEAMAVIDRNALQIALVVDDEGRLLGTVTDGDVRRGILKHVPLDDPVARIMFSTPTVARVGEDREAMLAKMRRRELRHIPVLDESGRVIDLKILGDLLQSQTIDNLVVLMAGGQGARLRPLTNDCPKPLLKVGGRAILETILQNFIEYGFSRFFISVNYMAEMIEAHFGDGSAWGVEITYLREPASLGTAGALSLLPIRPESPLIVMNGDLLTRVNFNFLLDFHREHHAAATMCVREYDFQVPYGVVEVDQHHLVRIEEKPTHSFFINAGIYALEPQVLDLIPSGDFLDMTTLFETMLTEGWRPAVFPIREHWLDIGRMGDFEYANGEYWRKFAPKRP